MPPHETDVPPGQRFLGESRSRRATPSADGQSAPARDARPRWTEASIRSALSALLSGRRTWPTYDEFASVGAKGLRDAVGRIHGPAWWAAEMGVNGGGRRRGGVRRWSDATIRSALAEILADREEWPTYRQLREDGHAGLSEALRHHGGARRWAAEMGVGAAGSLQGRLSPCWTDERIARELSAFLGAQAEWPRYLEFVTADRVALYKAVARHGGPERWARRMGVGYLRRRGAPPIYWTETRIRQRLGQLLRGRDRWPTQAEFRAADEARLLAAVHRHGGVERWRAEFRVSPTPRRGTPRAAAPRIWTETAISAAVSPLIHALGRWPTRDEFRAAGLTSALSAIYRHGGSAYWQRQFGVTARQRPEPAWADERIAHELSGFLADQVEWPAYADFVATGRASLYKAVTRHGGTEQWARRMGVRSVRRRSLPAGYWTETRIRERLGPLLLGRQTWPTQAEFAAAGETRLLAAIRRLEGVERWQAEFGVAPSRRDDGSHTGRRRRWTEAAIAAAISPLIHALGRWPTQDEFRAAGLTPALSALHRYGGSAHWQRRLGVSARPVPRADR